MIVLVVCVCVHLLVVSRENDESSGRATKIGIRVTIWRLFEKVKLQLLVWHGRYGSQTQDRIRVRSIFLYVTLKLQ